MNTNNSTRSIFFVVAFVVLALGAAFLFLDRAGAQSKDQPPHPTAAVNTKTADDLKSKLTPEQYRVAVQCGTEPAFRNEYWNNHKPGIYVDIISGKPLFT